MKLRLPGTNKTVFTPLMKQSIDCRTIQIFYSAVFISNTVHGQSIKKVLIKN